MTAKLSWIIRIALLIGGVYALWRGEQLGRAEAIARQARLEEYAQQLEKETEADIQWTNDQFASIYRSTNTILAYAGLEPIGDGHHESL